MPSANRLGGLPTCFLSNASFLDSSVSSFSWQVKSVTVLGTNVGIKKLMSCGFALTPIGRNSVPMQRFHHAEPAA